MMFPVFSLAKLYEKKRKYLWGCFGKFRHNISIILCVFWVEKLLIIV